MENLYQADGIYKQGCIDGAMRFADEMINDFQSQDKGKARTTFKSAVERTKRKIQNLDMDSYRNGFVPNYDDGGSLSPLVLLIIAFCVGLLAGNFTAVIGG